MSQKVDEEVVVDRYGTRPIEIPMSSMEKITEKADENDESIDEMLSRLYEFYSFINRIDKAKSLAMYSDKRPTKREIEFQLTKLEEEIENAPFEEVGIEGTVIEHKLMTAKRIVNTLEAFLEKDVYRTEEEIDDSDLIY